MRRPQLLLLVAGVAILLGTAQAQATTNQFRGVNWADPRDNFQSGVVYVSGLSSSDTYASASATGTSVMTQFVSKLGANAVRMPINEATVSSYWGTYTGAIDAVLAPPALSTAVFWACTTTASLAPIPGQASPNGQASSRAKSVVTPTVPFARNGADR